MDSENIFSNVYYKRAIKFDCDEFRIEQISIHVVINIFIFYLVISSKQLLNRGDNYFVIMTSEK